LESQYLRAGVPGVGVFPTRGLLEGGINIGI